MIQKANNSKLFVLHIRGLVVFFTLVAITVTITTARNLLDTYLQTEFRRLDKESKHLDRIIAEKRSLTAIKRQQVEDLSVIIKQINQYEMDVKSLQNRINTINQLRENQIKPVMMMEELNRRLPGDIWFSHIRTTGQLITIRGVGLTLSTIGDFIASLETSPYFHSVSLKISRLITMNGCDVYEFELDFRLL